MDTKKTSSSAETPQDTFSLRYQSSKLLFMYGSMLFFLNFFLVWARMYDDILIQTLPFMYIVFLGSLCFLGYYFLCKRLGQNSMTVKIGVGLCGGVVFGLGILSFYGL